MTSNLTSKLIRASAGTGKTHRLSIRYLELILNGEHPEKILATTFTRKAAAEIRERIFRRLALAASSEIEAEKLNHDLGIEDLTTLKAQWALRRLVDNQHRLNICTLDSLFFQIAAIFCSELGMSQGWIIADETTNQKVRREAVRALFASVDSEELIRLLLKIYYGAYSRGVEQRIMREVLSLHQLYRDTDKQAWIWPNEVIQFSEENFNSLKEEFSKLNLPKNKDGSVSKIWKKAKEQGYADLEARNWLQFCNRGLASAVLAQKTKFQNQSLSEELQVLMHNILQYVRVQVLNYLKEQTAATYELLSCYDNEYERMRQADRSLGFDDVKQKLISASFLNNLDEVYYRLDTRISHLLLDEFQDTSNNEWQVLAPIVDEVLSKAGVDYSFFCVGDVKQAIYGWRGGNAEIINHLEANWPQLDIEPLDATYRCAPAIIEVVNKVFSNLTENPALTEHFNAVRYWQDQFHPHHSKIRDFQGYVELKEIGIEQGNEEEENGRLNNTQRKDLVLNEAAWLVKDLVTTYPQAVVGVLTRTNNSASKLVQFLAHESIGIKASEEGKSGLKSSLAVQLILSAIRLAQHPGDTISAFHVASSILGKSLGFTEDSNLGLRIEFGKKIRSRLYEQGFGVLLSSLISEISFNYATTEQKKLVQLTELAYRFDRTGSFNIDDFIRFIETEVVEDNEIAQVRVMTIHQAKGLEFDVVVLADLIDDFAKANKEVVLTYRSDPMKPPEKVCRAVGETLRSLDPQLETMAKQQEELRIREALSLLYVALTRARLALYMLTSKKTDPAKLRTTFGDILVGALKNNDAEVVYQGGNADWEIRRDIELGSVPLVFETPKLKIAPERSRTLLRQTPSELEGSNIVDLNRLLNFENREQRFKSIELGLIVHKVFEQIRWRDESPSPLSEIQGQVSAYTKNSDLVHQAINLVEKALCNKEIEKLFRKETYSQGKGRDTQLFLEHPFAYRADDRIISGIIDRLVIVTEKGSAVEAQIIDYKTDWIEENSIQDRVKYYSPQMEAYRLAVHKFSKLELNKIGVKLVFVKCLQIVSV